MSSFSTVGTAVVRQPWKALMAALVLSASSAVYFSFSPVSASTPEPENSSGKGEWVPAKRGDFEVLCREDGELKPLKVTSMSFLRWGKVSFLIPDGSNVKKGDRLVGLETRELEEETQRMQEDYATAEKNLAQQQQTRDLEIKRIDTDLQTELERVEVARLRERELLNKPLKEDREEAENTLATAQARLANAKADLEAIQPLAEKGFASGDDIRARDLAVKKAEVELERAKITHKKTMDGAMIEDRQKAALTRESAELALRVKQIDAVDKKDDYEAKVQAAERLERLLKQKLERRQAELNRSALFAPHDGIAIHRSIDFRGNKKVQIGDNVHPWAVPVELPSFERMKVRTQVPESFIRLLRARQTVAQDDNEKKESNVAPVIRQRGSPARVIVSTQADRVYTGEVTWIDGWARDRNSKLSDADIKAQGLSGVRIFDVEVELLESDMQRLREGFRAVVEFPVETIKDVVYIPVNAVTMRDGATQVRVLDANGEESWRKVELGVQSIDRVVVTAGLKDGERVFTPRPPPKPAEAKKKAVEEEKPKESARGGRDGGMAPGVPGGPSAGGPGGAGPGAGGEKGGGEGTPRRRRGGDKSGGEGAAPSGSSFGPGGGAGGPGAGGGRPAGGGAQ